MSDLTGPVEAGARAYYQRGPTAGKSWDELHPLSQANYRQDVVPIVAAALAAHDAIGSLADAARAIARLERTITTLRAQLATQKETPK